MAKEKEIKVIYGDYPLRDEDGGLHFDTEEEAIAYVMRVEEQEKAFLEKLNARRLGGGSLAGKANDMLGDPTPADDRISDHEPPAQMIFTKLGEPYSEIMIKLSNGTLIPESKFGKPPPDLTFEEMEVWYENREDELLFGDADE